MLYVAIFVKLHVIVVCILFLFLVRFKLIGRVGQSVTALACCIGRPNEVLVAVADYTIRCIDIGETHNNIIITVSFILWR